MGAAECVAVQPTGLPRRSEGSLRLKIIIGSPRKLDRGDLEKADGSHLLGRIHCSILSVFWVLPLILVFFLLYQNKALSTKIVNI